MKFNDIPLGTRFLFEGMEYTKTSPVLATAKDGKPRLIRKSATLTPVDGAVSLHKTNTKASRMLDREKTLEAFEVFYQACMQVAGEVPELQIARRKFMDALE